MKDVMEFLSSSTEQIPAESELLSVLDPESVDYKLISQIESSYDKAVVLALYAQLYSHFAKKLGGYSRPHSIDHHDDMKNLLSDHYFTGLHSFYTRLSKSYSSQLAVVASTDRFKDGGKIRVIPPDLCQHWSQVGVMPVSFRHDLGFLLNQNSPEDRSALLSYTRQRREYTEWSCSQAAEYYQAANSTTRPRYKMCYGQLRGLLGLLKSFEQAVEVLQSFHYHRPEDF